MLSGIVLENVTKRYRADLRPAVEALSLQANPAEILALLGPSGCGKTTALRLIMGFEAPDSGCVRIGERIVADASHAVPPERRGVGMVFQDYALFPHLTVGENVTFGLRRLCAKERRRAALRILRVCELDGLADRYPHELSGGQKQRVALARALAPGYPIVLLDEPLASLDADLRAQLGQELRRLLKESGRTTVLVTHDQAEALQIADRVGVLRDGRLEQIGTPEEVYHAPATRFVATFVGEADFLPGIVRADGIHTEIGVLPGAQAFRDHPQVDVLVRPEHVGLAADPAGQALVIERRFRGGGILYEVRLRSGRCVRSHQPSTHNLPAGTRVTLQVSPARVAAFAALPSEASRSSPIAPSPADAFVLR